MQPIVRANQGRQRMAETLAQLEGWTKWGGEEPFEDHAGPFYMKLNADDGAHLSAFLCEKHHFNGGGFLHGGMLMSFADYALFVIAHDELEDQHSVTVSCQTEFLKGAAPLGELVYARGHVSRNTRSLIFVKGEISVGDDTLATFGGILKKIAPRTE
jgi:acyl-coenzyme A thioesterase PaaI-like protein